MKRSLFLITASALALWLTSSFAAAEDILDQNDCDKDFGTLDYCDCERGGVFGSAELLLFKYYRADGVRVGDNPGEVVAGSHLAAPRIAVGYVTAGGLGTRVRWFEWDHGQATVNGLPETLGVNTQTLDLEVFERFALNDCWTVEFSGGVRYNDFREVMVDPLESRTNSFHGWGGFVGLEGVRTIGRWGNIYLRGRGAVMNGDRVVSNTDATGQLPPLETDFLNDATLGMTEIALGYEYARVLNSGALLRLRVGYEWQNWYNYSSAFVGPVDLVNATASPASGESTFVGPADVGFSGVAFSLSIER